MAYTIEEEQEIAALKTWWRDNYKSLFAVIIIALGSIAGWRYWQHSQVAKVQQMSVQYDQLLFSTQDDAKKNAQIDEFVKANGNTGYATFALFEQARMDAAKQDFDGAEKALKQAISNAPDQILSSVAALRLSSVQFQQQHFDDALASLNQVIDPSWASRKALFTGDIQLAKGDKAAAKLSYETAQKNASPLEQQWVQMRLNNL